MEEEEREEAHAGPSHAIAHSSSTAEEEESNNRLLQLDNTHAGDGDTSMAEDSEAPDQEEVLYYVDAEGNRIDPSDMGDYSVVEVERQLEEQVIEQSKETSDSTMVEDVDQHGQMHTVATAVADGTEHARLTTMQEEEEGHDQPTFTMKVEEDEANHPGAQAEGDADHEDVHDHEPQYEQDEATRARYERPFEASPSYLSDNNINHNHTTTINNEHNGNETPSKQNNTTPDYKVRFTISGHKKNVSCIQFSPDGRWLMTAGGDGRILLYSLPSPSFMHYKPPTFIRSYTIPTPPPVKIPSNKSANSVPPVGSNGVNHIVFSPDSRYFAVASDDKIVRIWKVPDIPGAAVGSAEEDRLDESTFPSRQKDDNGINGPSASTTVLNAHHEIIGHNSNGDPVLSSSSLARSTEHPIELKGHTSFVFCVAFTPQGNLLASGSYDETIKIWDLKRGTCLRTLPAHSDPVAAVGFSGDGSILCSAGHDGLLRLWDTASGQCLKSLVDESNPPASHALFTPNSRYILVSSLDSTIRLWDYHAAVCIKTYTGHKNVKYSIPAMFAQAPNGKSGPTYIITGSENGEVVFYDLQSRNIAFTLPGNKETPMLCLAYHQQSGMLATCALERGVKNFTLRLWLDESRRPRPAGDGKQANGH